MTLDDFPSSVRRPRIDLERRPDEADEPYRCCPKWDTMRGHFGHPPDSGHRNGRCSADYTAARSVLSGPTCLRLPVGERSLVLAAPTGHLPDDGAAHELSDGLTRVEDGPDGADVVPSEVHGDAPGRPPLGEERRQLGQGRRGGAALPIVPREVVDPLVAVVADDAPVEPPAQDEINRLVLDPKHGLWHDALQLRRVLAHQAELGAGGVSSTPRLRYVATPRNGSLAGTGSLSKGSDSGGTAWSVL